MKRLSPILVLASLLLSSCAGTGTSGHKDMTAEYAAYMSGSGPVTGTFLMRVHGVGRNGGRVFLNSEANFRASTCLSIEVPEDVAIALGRELGGEITEVLKGKLIRVSGTAQKVPIWTDLSGTTHYQTHLVLEDPTKLVVAKK